MATIVTRAGKGTPLTNTEVDANFTNLNTDKAELSGATFTGDVKLGDNDKATFGAGDDLQIYHDGFNTLIKESGAGSLLIDATNTYFRNAAGTKDYAWMVDGGAVSLFYDNALKLITTSTGIDVTGTATMDGLVVEGAGAGLANFYRASVNANFSAITFKDTTNTNINAKIGWNANELRLDGTDNVRLVTDAKNRLLVTNNGDISFYEDTGSSPKFFWDASAESLGIGNSAPVSYQPGAVINVGNTSDTYSQINLTSSTSGKNYIGFGDATSGTGRYQGLITYDHSANVMGFGTAASTAYQLSIDSSGNVGIGTSLPASALDVTGTGTFGALSSKIKVGLNGDSISSDADFYIQTSTANALILRTNFTEAMRIDSAGNVGVGTSSPASTLEIAKNDQTNGATLSITNSHEGSGWTAGDTVGSIDFRIDDSSAPEKVRGQIKVFDDTSVSTTYPAYSAMSFSTSLLGTFAERMRISSAGFVGIGTDSPTRPLTVNGNNGTGMIINDAANDKALRFRATGDAFYIEATNNAESAYANIALSGNVGVGTSSPSQELHVVSSGESDIRLQGSGSANHLDIFHNASDFGLWGTGTQVFKLATNSTERMRIDSAGNLLVGTTSVQGAGGVTLSGAGYVYSSRPSSTAIYADRTGSDGAITEFRKDGAPVGSIGSAYSEMYIGSGATGLYFNDTGKVIHTINTTTLSGNSTDGTVDLGRSGTRFKDLYLSGGVYLGGTGAANKLDSYEEGTWTPTLGNGATAINMTGKYTKVGNLVTAYLILENSTISGTPDYIVSGLPFTSLERTPLSVTYYRTFNTACESLGGFVAGNGNTMQFVGMVQGGNWAPSALTAGSARYLFATAVYQTS